MIAAAVCPHPPLLVEPFDRSRVAELVPVRDAARSAVRALLATDPERVVVLAAGGTPEPADEAAGGDLGPWGVAVAVGGPEAVLGLAHAVGAWLLDDAGWTGPRRYADRLDGLGPRDAVLAMVDGSTTRTLKAPGYLDERSESYDDAVADALAAGDAAALSGLDVELGHELGAAGIQTLVELGRATTGAGVDGTLRLHEAPLGVGYWVADWRVGA